MASQVGLHLKVNYIYIQSHDVYRCHSFTLTGENSPRVSSARLSEPLHEISNNVVYATSKASDQPAHTRSLIRAFASRLSIL